MVFQSPLGMFCTVSLAKEKDKIKLFQSPLGMFCTDAKIIIHRKDFRFKALWACSVHYVKESDYLIDGMFQSPLGMFCTHLRGGRGTFL